MTLHLVDSASLIDFSKGIEPQTWRLLALITHPDHEVAVCDVIVTEFMGGVLPAHRATWHRFFASLPYLAVPLAAAAQAGEDCYDLARRGAQIRTPDMLIGATARARRGADHREPEGFPDARADLDVAARIIVVSQPAPLRSPGAEPTRRAPACRGGRSPG
jgi:predicted nucleic acid-binding protein